MGGTASFLAHGRVIWGFTLAPNALVTVLRKITNVSAILFGVAILREPLDFIKLASTLATISGAILLGASIS